MVAMALAGCNGNNRNNQGAGSAGTGTETGAAATGTASDTATGVLPADTAHNGAMPDSAKANQTKSGVTDTKTGKSTLGPGVTKTRPDQGQPVTSKGDTINQGVDSAR
jgi:hypothetical protein